MTFQLLVTLMGALMSLGHFPQAWRIWRARSADGISLVTYSIFSIGSALWTLYGFQEHDRVIIWSFLPGWVGSWLVLALTVSFRIHQPARTL